VPHFNIIKNNEIKSKSFRVAQLYDQFDLHEDSFAEHFEGDIDLEDGSEWSIGAIIGKSGTGKSSIAKELFEKYIFTPKYKENCVIDDFPKMESMALFKILADVGFSSPPSWLKPYSVLSQGEKMRVDLARAICADNEIIVFDEFTSVVDREIAQLGSFALQRAIRKANKKFIAVTCHYDVIDWLEPDWLFCTDTMKQTRGCHRRPQINIEVYETKGYWELFKRYHYLTHIISPTSKQFVAFYNDKPVGFIAYCNMPHPVGVLLRVHRLVILPDYQGLGIGKKLLSTTAGILSAKYERIGITTSLNGFAKSLMRDRRWQLCFAGRQRNHNLENLKKTSSENRNTYSFRWTD
jgi:GNAT superfamily N-acetyltransferase